MIENNKTYGFTIAVKELRETVPNLFRYASAYKRLNNLKSQGLWEMFVEPQEVEDESASDKKASKKKKKKNKDKSKKPEIDPHAMEGETYNMCHFWSNFEIARLDWLRSKEYMDFFEMMDRSGGFWMERVSFAFNPISHLTCTNHFPVGRRTRTLSCGWRITCYPRYSLLPRYWLSPHHHSTLSSERSRASATHGAIL